MNFLNKISLRNFKSSFLKNTLILTLGSVLAQGITVFISPILTRLYTPNDFGVLGIYISIVSIISVFICGSYELAIMLPEEDNVARHIFLLSVIICFILTGFVFIIIFIFRYQICEILKTSQLLPWLWLVPLNVLAVGIFQSLNYWTNRKKQFKKLAISRITQSIVTAIVQIFCGILNIKTDGLIVGRITGQISASLVLFGNVFRNNFSFLTININFSNLFYVLKKYKKFPLYLTWGRLLDIGSFHVVPLLLSGYFTSTVAGFYMLGFRTVQIPMALVGRSIGQVFFQKISEEWNKKSDISQIVCKTISRLIIVFAGPFLCLYLFAPILFPIVFGKQWLTAGKYVQILTPMLFLQFITSPVSTVLVILQKQNIIGLIQTLLLISAVLPLYIGGIFLKEPMKTLTIFSFSQCLVYVLYIFFILKYSHVRVNQLLKGLLFFL